MIDLDAKSVWAFVQGGKVLSLHVVHEGQAVRVLPLARTHDDARRLIRWIASASTTPRRVSPARLGSVDGQDAEEAIRDLLNGPAYPDGALIVVGWSDAGAPLWGQLVDD